MGSLTTLFTVVTNIISVTWATKEVCQYNLYLDIGEKFYISNPNSPNKYSAGDNCRWWVQSPIGTNILVSCVVKIPSVDSCRGDKVKISLTGDTSFSNSKNYCGSGKVSLVSQSNRLAVALEAKYNSPGGKFSCTLSALKQNLPNPDTPDTLNCDCGWKRGTRIVGGVPTLVNEYPAMAALIDASIKEVTCGATIISNRYVITAAHCMRAVRLDDMGVLVGDWDIKKVNETPAVALYKAEKYWEHPEFDTLTGLNDLAIVKTNKPIRFSLLVGPICLPFLYSYKNFVPENVTILGWGDTFFNGPPSDYLQKIEVPVISNTECQRGYPNTSIYPSQLCTFAKNKDACQHDSGGPVLWLEPASLRLQLVGVVSYGYGCAANKPSVNTRITSYLQWIVKIAFDTSYCVK